MFKKNDKNILDQVNKFKEIIEINENDSSKYASLTNKAIFKLEDLFDVFE